MLLKLLQSTYCFTLPYNVANIYVWSEMKRQLPEKRVEILCNINFEGIVYAARYGTLAREGPNPRALGPQASGENPYITYQMLSRILTLGIGASTGIMAVLV